MRSFPRAKAPNWPKRSSKKPAKNTPFAGEKMQELIAAAGTSEDKLVSDFKKLRREHLGSRRNGREGPSAPTV